MWDGQRWSGIGSRVSGYWSDDIIRDAFQPANRPNPGGIKGRGALVPEGSRLSGPYPRRAGRRAADMSLSDRERAEGFVDAPIANAHIDQ
jgi:hypothetical protein